MVMDEYIGSLRRMCGRSVALFDNDELKTDSIIENFADEYFSSIWRGRWTE